MSSAWYVIQVYSGFEKKVMRHLLDQAKIAQFDHLLETVLVPSMTVTEVRKGQRVQIEQKTYPGYVLIKMQLTDDTWHLVMNTPKVTGFLGSKLKPIPISEKDAEKILRHSEGRVLLETPSVDFQLGELVRVSDGPFSTFQGLVEDIDNIRERLKVSVSIFGRSTPVELDYSQVEKVK